MSRRSASRAPVSCSLCAARKFFCFEPHDASSFTQHRTKVRRLRDTSSLASMASLAMVSWQWHEASCKSLERKWRQVLSSQEQTLHNGRRLDRTRNSLKCRLPNFQVVGIPPKSSSFTQPPLLHLECPLPAVRRHLRRITSCNMWPPKPRTAVKRVTRSGGENEERRTDPICREGASIAFSDIAAPENGKDKAQIDSGDGGAWGGSNGGRKRLFFAS